MQLLSPKKNHKNLTIHQNVHIKEEKKSWFDKDLQALKKKTNQLSNLKHSQPGNLDIQNAH